MDLQGSGLTICVGLHGRDAPYRSTQGSGVSCYLEFWQSIMKHCSVDLPAWYVLPYRILVSRRAPNCFSGCGFPVILSLFLFQVP